MIRAIGLLALLASMAIAASTPGCIAIAGERILASDLARGIAAFSNLPPDTQIGYAPVPGARRFYRTPELQRLAMRHNVALAPNEEVCFEQVLEPLATGRIVEAMRTTLGVPDARIEIVELSRYPVPPGQIEFVRSALPPASTAPVLWRGFVRYSGQRRFAIWARVKILVRTRTAVAAENLPAGQRIESRQVRFEERDAYPARVREAPPADEIAGRIPRRPISPGSAIYASMLDAPKDVERGDLVQVEVQSGRARLQLEARAQAAGRRGDAIPVRNQTTGKNFSARVADKGRVVVTKDQRK